MESAGTQRDGSPADAPMLGDHLAMDLLNTKVSSNGEIVEYWNNGDDVLRWLKRCGVVSALDGKAVDLAELLKQATTLRTLAHRLIVRRKDNKKDDVRGLNEYLHAYLSAPHLDHD